MSILFRDVEIDGARVDVRVVGEYIAEIGRGLSIDSAELIDGGAGALLPGLHDHHLHLLALAATRRSVDCGPPSVTDLGALARALRAHAGSGWVRGTGYHESVAGDLDRHVLDRLLPYRPVRVQHRSGALWILNSVGVDTVSRVLDATADVERDESGAPTGRLWRYDSRLRPALPADVPDLAQVGETLARYGITSVTDATPDLDDTAIGLLSSGHRSGALPQSITLLGADNTGTVGGGLSVGPRKLLLRDHDLPTFDQLAAAVAGAHSVGRAVAVHCVSRESLLLSMVVFDGVGSIEGDRIEHAGIVPEGVAEWISRLGLRVVTQPGFLSARGDDYLRDVASDDLPYLYPYASLLRAGVKVTPSSDAPHGPLDPWAVMRAATDRTARSGAVLGPDECVTPMTALAGYLGTPGDPGGPPRHLACGVRADLCLLGGPLRQALTRQDASWVRMVVIGGRIVVRDE
ncbi:amidohydrolase family protein [Nocardia uniformis]|uniref:Amidohydrolase family protein n=1 Tax=Nocardia uniformis TaxID=53432 RepID=A0A849C4Y6_9NOCA|nr:amidohydrolase family protein [Nocardia uniformis]NNH70867.1 amidohydrolase family protein [Nocardia uniformis]